jgi:plastocyanin
MSHKLVRLCGALLVLFALVSVLLAACARPGTAQGTTSRSATPTSASSGAGSTCATGTVHTLATSFQESCVNVAKGSSLKVVPVVQSFHILTNGSWVNNTATPSKEPGAPTIRNVQVTTSTIQIGPFTTAGTFHIYCTVHPGMQVTVYVK